MYRKAFIYSALIFGFLGPCAADEQGAVISTAAPIQSDINVSTATSVFPKLLWEKKLSKPIISSAISRDGTKIAIADETGYLTLYNTRGEKLWDYHYEGELPKRTLELKSDKSPTAFLNIAFSRSGKYVVCNLGVLNTWEDYEGGGKYEGYFPPYKKMCFNSEGKLLWQTFRTGWHVIGGDDYISIKAAPPEDDPDPDVAPVACSLLDTKGQAILADRTVIAYSGCYGFSEDGKYAFLGNKLFEVKSGRVLWEFTNGQFSKIRKNLAVISEKVIDSYGAHSTHDCVYDIPTRKKLLDVGSSAAVSLTDNYVASINRGMGVETLSVYKIKTGHVVWTRQYGSKDFPGNSKWLYLTKDEQRLLAGSEKTLLFYDMKGRKIWELPTGYEVAHQYPPYPITESRELFLVGSKKAVKLYKSF